MNFKVAVTVLFIAALGFGIVGCSTYNSYDNPHSFQCSTTMDNVLHAAVRHKCLPQVLTSTEVMCTSVQDPKNILVKITLSNNKVIIANIWKSLDLRAAVEDYDKKKIEYELLKNDLESNESLTKELKSVREEKLKNLEKDLDKRLGGIEDLRKAHRFPTMDEYNAWVRAFEEKIQAETNH